MFLLVALLIMMSTYVAVNEQIDSKYRTGWFAVVGVCTLIVILYKVLLA